MGNHPNDVLAFFKGICFYTSIITEVQIIVICGILGAEGVSVPPF